jgi:hypothetical protein
MSSEEFDCVSALFRFSYELRVAHGADRRGGAGMVEIVFELRLIFPPMPAVADIPRG